MSDLYVEPKSCVSSIWRPCLSHCLSSQIIWEQDPDTLKVREDVTRLEELGRFDMAALEGGVAKLESGFKAVQGALQLAAKANSEGGEVDPLERILKVFCTDAEEQLPQAAKALADAKATFVDTAKLFGETDQSIAKLKPEGFLKEFMGFVKNIDGKRKTKQERLDRENKKKAKEAAKAAKK
eukprot:Blabericola_migrator_1__1786@NODE_1484_length_4445_cov_14_403381_g974_i0_p5_GENE_NODE_1484_length_4445_cov_14_403381_g974_i0NODE_1484_length_4445_cov_14_403381_g974_i0_p5_ORF_typecomplete_len182_score56_49FH2/PF02181_23/4_8e14T7SS_ESX_EspC/PF10824_8/0_056_NODE_1484_length_4445_cov_14_403381_g974_i012971842